MLQRWRTPDIRWPSSEPMLGSVLASKLLHSSGLCPHPCLWVCKCLACWTRLLPVTLSGDCEIVALRQLRTANTKLSTAALNLWETSTAAMGETKCPGSPLMAVGNVTRTWRFVQTGRCQLTAKGNSWPRETRVNTVRRGFIRLLRLRLLLRLDWIWTELSWLDCRRRWWWSRQKGNRNPSPIPIPIPILDPNTQNTKPKTKTQSPTIQAQNGTHKITLTALAWQSPLPWLWMRWTFVCISRTLVLTWPTGRGGSLCQPRCFISTHIIFTIWKSFAL